MRIRPAHLALCGALLLGTLAACGGDDEDGTKTDDSATTSSQVTSTTAGGSGVSANGDLERLCADTETFTKDVSDFAAAGGKDSAKAQALNATAQDLGRRADALEPTLDASDAPRLRECGQELAAAGAALGRAMASSYMPG